MSYSGKPRNEFERCLTDELISMSDSGYRDFQSALVPNIDKENIIGVRTPELKRLARRMHRDGKGKELLSLKFPLCCYDEMLLYLFVLSLEKDFDTAVIKLENALDFIDNWAVCDSFSSKAFSQNKDKLIKYVEKWLKSDKPYTQRLALDMLIKYYLDDKFDECQLEWVLAIDSDEYYVNLAIAWYISIALIKQYPSAIKIIEQKRLKPKVHNKSIQKACESRRTDEKTKAYLKSLWIKK